MSTSWDCKGAGDPTPSNQLFDLQLKAVEHGVVAFVVVLALELLLVSCFVWRVLSHHKRRGALPRQHEKGQGQNGGADSKEQTVQQI